MQVGEPVSGLADLERSLRELGYEVTPVADPNPILFTTSPRNHDLVLLHSLDRPG